MATDQLEIPGIGPLKWESKAALEARLSAADSPLAGTTRDVIAGSYEGGLVLWECCRDLCLWMGQKGPQFFNHKRILELGCGAGLPGILGLKMGASSLTLHDFNAEVIQHFTEPSLALNCDSKEAERAKLLSGDWARLSEQIPPGSADVILMSETLYRPASYPALLAALDHALTADGEIIVASKGHYFGLGGSIPAFRAALDEHEVFGGFQELWKTPASVSVPRKIVRFQRL